MGKYLVNRIIRGLFSIVCVVAIVMTLIYSAMDRNLIFAADPMFTKVNANQKKTYMYRKWEEYGYLDYVPYAEWLIQLTNSGVITEETRAAAVKISKKESGDSATVKKYVKQFTDFYEAQGYTVVRIDAVMMGNSLMVGGEQQLFAFKDIGLLKRLGKYLGNVFQVDNIHKVQEDIGERKLTFTLYDPVYGGEKFSPALIGNGTTHRYLIYFDHKFPYLHQNLLSISLGKSYSVTEGIDVFTTMTQSQGAYVLSEITYPTGHTELSADDLHTATYVKGSLATSAMNQARFVDDYTSVITHKDNMSRMGFSFVIGIIATAMAYLLGIPLGISMAKNKDKLIDKIGTVYIIFIIAVPSLAYIFLFKAIGGKLGLPITFNLQNSTWVMYVLPIVSLALPSIAGFMRWLRRYMIDQMNSDYVKFARSGGLSESEIFSKHILKNAIIPIVHGIPGAILGSVVGGVITESVYVVPGTGKLLTTAIGAYDNSVIVGMALFFAILSVTSMILGDVLMATVDPRISFSTKAR